MKCDGLQNSANIELYLFSDKIRVALLAQMFESPHLIFAYLLLWPEVHLY